MSSTPEEPEVELVQRVDQVEQGLELARVELDSAKTANAVLQERYGVLVGQNDALTARIEALESAGQ